MERDPGHFLNPVHRPAEQVVLASVRDIKNIFGLPGLGLDNRPGRRIEGNGSEFISLTSNNGPPFLDVRPPEVEDLGLSHAGIEGEPGQVVEKPLSRRAGFPPQLPGGRQDLLDFLIGEGPQRPILPVEADLPEGIVSPKESPILGPVEQAPEDLGIAVDRGPAEATGGFIFRSLR